MAEQGKIDYLVLVDISYADTCQQVFPKEWMALLAELDRRASDAGFSTEGLFFYCSHTIGRPGRLEEVINTLFDWQSYLASIDWVLEFNIVLLCGEPDDFSLTSTVEDLFASLPGVDRIWRYHDDRLLLDQLAVHLYQHVYSVDGWRTGVKRGPLETLTEKKEHQSLLRTLKHGLRDGGSYVLSGPPFAGKSSFVETLLRAVDLPAITLRSCPGCLEPQSIFQPLLDYCLGLDQPWPRRSRALLEQARVAGSLTLRQLCYDVPELLSFLPQRSFVLLCEGVPHWPEVANTVLASVLQGEGAPPCLWVGEEVPTDAWLRFPAYCYPPTGWVAGDERPGLTPRMVDFLAKVPQQWRGYEIFEDFVDRLLSEEDRAVCAFVREADGLLTRWDLLHMAKDLQPSLEILLSWGLIRENGSLFSCLALAADEDVVDKVRQRIARHWLGETLTVDQGARLCEWGQLPPDRLQELVRSLSYRGLTSSIAAFRRWQGGQGWPLICEHWFQRSSLSDGAWTVAEGTEGADFVVAYQLCRAGKEQQSNERNKTLFYRYSSSKKQPLYFDESVLLHGLLLLMKRDFRDAHFYLSQIERRQTSPEGLRWASKVYQAVALFLAQDFDKCLSLIHAQKQRGERGQSYWGLYLDFVKLRLLFRIGSYPRAHELAEKLEQRAKHYRYPELAMVFSRWRQRCVIYQGDFAEGWTKLKGQAPCRERDVFMLEACIFAHKYQEAISVINNMTPAPSVQHCIDRCDWQDGFQAVENLVHLKDGALDSLSCEFMLLSSLAHLRMHHGTQADNILSSVGLRNSPYHREVYHYLWYLYQQVFLPGVGRDSLHLSHAVSLVHGAVNATRNFEMGRFLKEHQYWNRNILNANEQCKMGPSSELPRPPVS